MNAPIGIFDSGLGGLSVLRALVTTMPSEKFIYLGDTARLPYGSKSPQTIQKYLNQNIQYLKMFGIKALVVACNSASSVVNKDLKSSIDIPLFEVITPGSEKALSLSESQRIGVIGTRATINMKAYTEKLKALNPDVMVFDQACPLFVPFIEEGLTEDPMTNLLVFRYISTLVQKNIDTLILGCTHYPFLMSAIAKVTGPNIALVDSAKAISEIVYKYLNSQDKLNAGNRGSIEILCTDLNDNYKKIIERFTGPVKLDQISLVDI